MEKYVKYGLITLNILASLGIYVFLYYIFFYSDILDSSEPIIQNIISKNDDTEEDINSINVEIKGAVENPGVYTLTNINIIDDLIKLSGGFKDVAYTNNINLSRRLTDQMVVYVYTKSEYKDLNKAEIVYIEKECSCPTFDISSCTENGSSEIEDGPSTYLDSDSSESTLVNINTASKEELTTLSGIGNAKAEAIIKYREANGLFKNIEDIINVSGISENIYAKIKDFITI